MLFVFRAKSCQRLAVFCPFYLMLALFIMFLSEDVPSTFQSQQLQQQRSVAAIPDCTSATHSRVNQIQQESVLPTAIHFSASRSSSPSAEFKPGPREWPMNPLPASVWRSQERGYVEQANQQYKLEQQHQQQPSSHPAFLHFYSKLLTFSSPGCIRSISLSLI